MGFLKSPEIPLEGLIKIPLERLIKIPLEGNFFRFPRESEKTRTRAVGFLKTPEIPLEGNFFRFPREAEKSRTKAVRFLKSTEIPLEGLIFHPLHVADWPRVGASARESFRFLRRHPTIIVPSPAIGLVAIEFKVTQFCVPTAFTAESSPVQVQ